MRTFAAAVVLASQVACTGAAKRSEETSAPVPDASAQDAAAPPPAPAIVERSYKAMGTQVTLTAYTADEERALEAFDAGYQELVRLEALMTVWRPDSDVSRLNAAAGKSPIPISKETMEALLHARRFSEWSEGKFDVTFGALSGLWKFDHDQDDSLPSRAEIAKRLPLIDYRKLELDEKAGTAFLTKAGMSTHLGGIGKGYAVDRVVAILRQRGLSDFMVQGGGDLYVAGRHGDRPWRVGIRDPRGPHSRYFAATEVTNATFSTSGDYERFFIKNGVRYHHIIDPDTGQPARLCRSVTIMAPTAVMADGLSKCVFLLGPEKGLALIEKVEGTGAVIVDAENQVHISKRLEGRVKILFPPTDGD